MDLDSTQKATVDLEGGLEIMVMDQNSIQVEMGVLDPTQEAIVDSILGILE